MSELKPCPFCGGESRLYVSDGVRAMCVDCKASSIILEDRLDMNGKPYGRSIERVIELWNRRANNE